jgi:lipoprotein-anchoring transpeptidase ErfK/SrfK
MSRAIPYLFAGGFALIASPAAAQYQPRVMTAAGAWAPAAPTHVVARRPQANQFFFGADVPPPEWREQVAIAPSGAWYVPVPDYARESMRAQQMARPGGMIDPRFRRQVVPYSGPHRPGTIVINTAERHLYLIQAGGTAMRYGIGVGRDGFSWRGEKTVTRMAEWPDWRPPPQMLQRRPDLPRFMPGGPENPLGARALYLGSSLYRIHGSNEPHTIGHAVSSGCFRMINEDVTDLYQRVRVGTRVVVL